MEKHHILIIYIVVLLVQEKRYNWLLPTFPFYPNNNREVKIVLENAKYRTISNVDFFNKTDPSVAYAFEEIVEENAEQLKSIFLKPQISFFIKASKYFYNRARPRQISNNLTTLKSTTAATPSYPAGHAFQAYYLAKKLTEKYPHRKSEFYRMADRCDEIRVIAGLHYPSDGQYSKQLVEKYF